MLRMNGRGRTAAASTVAVALSTLAIVCTGAGAQSTDPQLDVTAPLVTISGAPKSLITTHRHRRLTHFFFESDDPAATFACRIDDGHFLPCASPIAISFRAGKGKGRRHTFMVRSRDLAGNSSGAAVRSLRVLHTPRPR